jgi:hypothetical protein
MLHEKFITDEEYQEALAEVFDVQPPIAARRRTRRAWSSSTCDAA